MKQILTILVIFGVLLTVGCGTQLPSPEVLDKQTANFQLPKLPEEDKAIVYIVRPAKIWGGVVRFKVYVGFLTEEYKVGSTIGGQYIYFSIQPGRRIIFSKSENTSSISIDVVAGDIIFFKQEVNPGGFVARNSLVRIPEIEGRYYVKKLKLGSILKYR